MQKDILRLLLSKQLEISGKFSNAIEEIIRFNDNEERVKDMVDSLINSVDYSLEEIERISSNYLK